MQASLRSLHKFGYSGEAHPEITMGGGIDRALAPVARADRRWQAFGGLEIDDQAMGREPPIDEADHRNGDIVQADFDLALIAIGIGQTILPEFGECAADIVRQLLAPQRSWGTESRRKSF
jgi:hypothetical protein